MITALGLKEEGYNSLEELFEQLLMWRANGNFDEAYMNVMLLSKKQRKALLEWLDEKIEELVADERQAAKALRAFTFEML